MGDVVLADVVHEHWSENAGHRPGGEQQAVDSTDIACAKHVLEICWNGGEAAAIHADDYQETTDETDDAANRIGVRHGAVQQEAKHHEHGISVLTSNIVGHGRPKEAATHIEQTHEADETRCRNRRDLAGEHFLAHRGSLAKHTDSSRNVEAEYPTR